MRHGRVPRFLPIPVLALCSVLAACGHLRDIGNEIRAEVFNSGPLAGQWEDRTPPVVSDRAGATPLAEVPQLLDVLETPPDADGTPPQWPKVAITSLRVRMDDSIDQIVNPSLLGYPKEGRCIFFDALVWHDAGRSERFPDISLCTEDLTPEGVHHQYLTWQAMRGCGPNSGRERTQGPLPPATPLPFDHPLMASWLRYDGPYFIHSLLKQMGHSRRANPCHQRFWVVAYELIDWEPDDRDW